jgi:hypothetical protein
MGNNPSTSQSSSDTTQHSEHYKKYVKDTSAENKKSWGQGAKLVCGGKDGKTALDKLNDKLPEDHAFVLTPNPTITSEMLFKSGKQNASGDKPEIRVPLACVTFTEVPSMDKSPSEETTPDASSSSPAPKR